MTYFYWFFFGLILVTGRFALLCSLYLLKTPVGDSLVYDYNRFIWHTLYAEIGFSMALAFVFFIASLFIKGNGLKVIKIISIIFAAIYLILSATDDELQRWMSQKLSLSFIKTYMFAFTDTGLVSKIFWGGLGHFAITVGLVISTITGLSIFSYKMNLLNIVKRPLNRKTIIAFVLTAFFTILGCTSHLWYHHSVRRWDRIRPVVYTLAGDILETFDYQKIPENYREGILSLGGNPDNEYPFWKENPNDSVIFNAFKNKPLEEKPDIILLTIESLRGWTSDMRVESNCKMLPNLCKLAKQGLYYPNTHSVGNPSVEGLLGIMNGVISHPDKTLLRDFPNTNLRAFSEILSDAGYYNEVILGADPRFDNEEAWYGKWFDYYEFKSNYDGDVITANRFVERYKERPKDRPTFFHWMSLSMHLPFKLPEDMGETPEDISVAYMRAEAYMDSALGIILDSIKNDSRYNNTLIILTGDHSFPNGKQLQASEKYGQASDGFTWISLIFAGPNITPRIDKRMVSQGWIAKSIIEYLNLDVSNHFMGINLINNNDSIAKDFPALYSFRYGGMAMRKDSLAYFLMTTHNNESATAQKSLLEPTWDTTQPVDGFIVGNEVNLSKEQLQKTANEMRAASHAWQYVIYTNKIKPATIE